MEKVLFLNTDPLHHAYLLIGQREKIKSMVRDFLLQSLGLNIFSSPDVRVFSSSNLSIDDVRQIKVYEEFKDFGGERKIFIIDSDFITLEAQNALLKILEEPTKGTHFFMIISQDTVIDTLRSRMYVLNLNEVTPEDESWLSSSLEEKLELIKKITDDSNSNPKQEAINFVNKIERELYNSGVVNNFNKIVLCQNTRKYLYDKGAPIKMILESFVLSL